MVNISIYAENWNVSTHQCSKFKLGHGCVITAHIKTPMYMLSLIHAIIYVCKMSPWKCHRHIGLWRKLLTLNEMVEIWHQRIFPNVFSWMTSTCSIFLFKFHWSSFLRAKLTTSQCRIGDTTSFELMMAQLIDVTHLNFIRSRRVD